MRQFQAANANSDQGYIYRSRSYMAAWITQYVEADADESDKLLLIECNRYCLLPDSSRGRRRDVIFTN